MEIEFEPFRAIVRRLTPLVHGNRDYWTDAVSRWATDPPVYGDDGVLPVPLPVKLTRDERIALLAAIYDACVTDAARIDPWRDPRDLPDLPAAPGGGAVPGEYQLAIRYAILVRDRVPTLSQHWDTHEAAIEIFIADIEKEIAGYRSGAAMTDGEAASIYQLNVQQLLRALECGNDDEALHTGLLQHIERIRDAARQLQLPPPLELVFDREQCQAGDKWAELRIRFPSGHYQKSATTFVYSPEELVIDAKDAVSIALKQWSEQLAQMESGSAGGDFIERLLAGPDQVELTPTDLAMLEAHLQQPVSFSAVQQEKKATGESPTNAKRNKLKLIRDYNRNLQTAAGPPAQPVESTPRRRGRKKADYNTEQREAKLAADWVRAKEAGVYKPQFAKDHGMRPAELEALLARVRKRKSRAD